MTNLFDLTGKTCLLTGASKGIGKSMAIALAQHGGTLIISSRKIDVLKKTAEEINEIIGEERVFPVAANAGIAPMAHSHTIAQRSAFPATKTPHA